MIPLFILFVFDLDLDLDFVYSELERQDMMLTVILIVDCCNDIFQNSSKGTKTGGAPNSIQNQWQRMILC